MSRGIKRSRWVIQFCEYVKAQFGIFKTKLEKQDEECCKLTIFNPNVKDRDITICFGGREALFLYSFQYTYFDYDDIDQLIVYINKFISEEYAAFQFFKNAKYLMSGCQRSKDIDLANIESILKTFIPDLNANQIEQKALMQSEVMHGLSYDEHKKLLSVSPNEARKRHYDIFRINNYKLAIEYWSGNKDDYKHIHWNGNEFEIIDISVDELLK